MDLEGRVRRDEATARRAKAAASVSLQSGRTFSPSVDFIHGVPKQQIDFVTEQGKRRSTLLEISEVPFHGMAEALITSDRERTVLWYANERTLSNEVVTDGDGEIRVVTWTHPGFQLALVGELGEEVSLRRHGYAFKAVVPLARARFREVLPAISGVYDPGGRVRPDGTGPRVPSTSLKAVKLDLTTEQVFAFVNRMDGFLLVTGAPGTGKTTVALQRIRFLFDQQNERDPDKAQVPYEPELTAVFLANRNLIEYSRTLLKEELLIPERVVHLVPAFIHDSLDGLWLSKQNARPRLRKISIEERRAREAFFNRMSLTRRT